MMGSREQRTSYSADYGCYFLFFPYFFVFFFPYPRLVLMDDYARRTEVVCRGGGSAGYARRPRTRISHTRTQVARGPRRTTGTPRRWEGWRGGGAGGGRREAGSARAHTNARAHLCTQTRVYARPVRVRACRTRDRNKVSHGGAHDPYRIANYTFNPVCFGRLCVPSLCAEKTVSWARKVFGVR